MRIDYTEPSWSERRRVLLSERSRLNYANWLDRLVGLYGRRTAFLLDTPIDYPGYAGDSPSFDDVGRLVSRMAGALRELGVGRGDRVGLMTMNRIEMAFCNFAAARLGAIPVPMNFMLRPNEIEYIVQRAGIEVLVCDPAVWEGTLHERSSVPSVKRWAMIATDSPPEGVVSMRALMAPAADHLAPVEPSSDGDTAILFFTSGTTGFPKGAMLSHAAAMIHVRQTGKTYALQPRMPRRLALLVMPVAHAAGYTMVMLNLALGTPSAFVSRFDPQEIFSKVDELRPTLFSGTPTMFRILLASGAAEYDWSSIKIFGGGADAFDDELIRTVREMGARQGPLGIKRLPWFIRGYGMAETNSYTTQTPPFEVGDNCVGRVKRGVEYRLVDEDGRDVPDGQPGELLLRGPMVTKGYWNDPEATAAAFTPDGWFRTGDVLRKGRWGMLYFVGRSGDIIKSGGYKISANEVDQTLMGHPDVEVSATVGIPHPLKGERPFAAVKLRAGATSTPEEVLAWARERIAPYKCPRGIVAVDAIPFTFSMKPKRREVKERLIRELPEEVQRGE